MTQEQMYKEMLYQLQNAMNLITKQIKVYDEARQTAIAKSLSQSMYFLMAVSAHKESSVSEEEPTHAAQEGDQKND